MSELHLIRTFSGFAPASTQDIESTLRVRIGDVITCQYRKARNPRFHRKFFSLLNLAFEYWNPNSQKTKSEAARTVERMRTYMMAAGISQDAATTLTDAFLKQDKPELNDYPGKSFEAFRRWATVEAGFFRWVATPAGPAREPISISFASMDDTEFSQVYKAVFDVLWVYILQHNFSNQQDAETAAERMIQYA